jgi:anti-sigma factor RsiW
VGGRIVDLLSSSHLATEALLPWLLNDTLTPGERRELESHLQSCASCRQELARQRELMALYAADPAPGAETDVDAAFAELSARLQTDTGRAELQFASRAKAVRGWRIAFAAQMAVLIAFGATVGWTLSQMQFTAPAVEVAGATGAYQGLAAPPAGAGDAIVLFDPNASEADLRRVLQRAGARIVDGPTAADAYVVRFERGTEVAIAALRADRSVRRIEILSASDR